MKIGLLLPSFVFAAGSAALAAPPTIESFDRNGVLTFREVPGALSYQVEWSSQLTPGPWSAEPPGIPFLPVLGTGVQSVTVSVAQNRGFYRVVAVMSPFVSTFDNDNQGWRVVAYPFRSHVVDPVTSVLPWDGATGNPAGSVRIGDIYGETGIAAPAAYLGNQLAFYGGSLSYDLLIRFTDTATYPAVVLNGGSLSLYYDTPNPALNLWQLRTVPLSETGWKVSGTGAAVTAEVFKNVLSQLAGIYIYTGWHSGADDTSVDNIHMIGP
jgi:hypothetical protein